MELHKLRYFECFIYLTLARGGFMSFFLVQTMIGNILNKLIGTETCQREVYFLLITISLFLISIYIDHTLNTTLQILLQQI